MTSVERNVSARLVGPVVSEAVRASRPRPGFSAELLGALRDAPRVAAVDPSGRPMDRFIVPGVIAGAICGAGLLWFELDRRSRQRRPPRNMIRRFI